MKILTLFTNLHVVPNPHYFPFSMKHNKRNSEERLLFSMQLQWVGSEAFKLQKKMQKHNKSKIKIVHITYALYHKSS